MLQQFAKEKDNLSYFLTYADNNAVTFFAKQGFTTEVTYSKDQVRLYVSCVVLYRLLLTGLCVVASENCCTVSPFSPSATQRTCPYDMWYMTCRQCREYPQCTITTVTEAGAIQKHHADDPPWPRPPPPTGVPHFQHCKSVQAAAEAWCHIMSPSLQWHGYIKDYDGGTLMESVLHKELPYTCMSHIITAQKEALEERISGLSTAFTLYPGLHFQEDQPLLTPGQIPGQPHILPSAAQRFLQSQPRGYF